MNTAWLRYANIAHREPEPSAELLLTLTEANVVAQIRNLRTDPAVAARLEQGDLSLHGWLYHISSGSVAAYNEKTERFESQR